MVALVELTRVQFSELVLWYNFLLKIGDCIYKPHHKIQNISKLHGYATIDGSVEGQY